MGRLRARRDSFIDSDLGSSQIIEKPTAKKAARIYSRLETPEVLELGSGGVLELGSSEVLECWSSEVMRWGSWGGRMRDQGDLRLMIVEL
jgi:hypothetical protein